MQIYPYYGRLNEMEFLKRLYKLDEMRSNDPRYKNAEEDIWNHTVNNDDYPACWVFNDERFPLKNGSDEDYLRFICEIFNPEVRDDDNSLCKEYLKKINELLCADRYELYANSQISGRNVYSWRTMTENEAIKGGFVPFSMRYEKKLKEHTLSICSISKKMRKEIVALMMQYEDQEYLTDETGLHHYMPTKKVVLDDIKRYYSPKAFDQTGKYNDVDNLDRFVTDNLPQYVFDAIELFAKYGGNDYINEINLIIRDLGYQLLGGKIELSQPKVEIEEPEHDNDLKDLIQQAESYYKENDSDSIQRALEKLWDAFERLKTYYGENKKQSLNSIEEKIAGNNSDLKDRIDNEFKELTNIGNKYQIRHFEKDKIPISDNRIRMYLYLRCSALINLSIKFIENK